MRVTVNPGHFPGIDPGAIGPNGVREADVALSIGRRCAQYLREAGHDVQLVQRASLLNICRETDESGAELFVSIHCNAATDPRARGFEVWIYRHASEKAKELAERVRGRIAETFPALTDRGIKESGFYVLKHTACSACLVETAFISNPGEENFLTDPAVQDGYARAIADGIMDCEGRA